METSRWRIEVSNSARRDLRRLFPDVRERIVSAFDGLAVVPRQGDIQKLQGADDEYRLRVGDWRVIFELDSARQVVRILIVAHRRDVYRR